MGRSNEMADLIGRCECDIHPSTVNPESSTSGVANDPITETRRLAALRRRCAALDARRELHLQQRRERQRELEATTQFLAIADGVSAALEALGEQLFDELGKLIESKLSLALSEVLEQPIQLKATRSFLRGAASLSFHIERNGNEEDIMSGQGGSVVNVLSVGLRLFGLTTLPEKEHRRFLVLDEQDCWLRPDLVPRLVKIVHAAGKALGFQIIMISHHDQSLFESQADKIYRFVPSADGVNVVELEKAVDQPDAG